MPLTAATVWRDYVTDGVPSSGVWNPQKSDIRALLAGVWANGYVSMGGNYTALTGDAGATIVLEGSAPATLTFGAASGYSLTHTNFVVNRSPRRLIVAPSGLTAQNLMPGQACIVMNLNNTWFMTLAGRWFKKDGINVYVDINGNDAHDGLAIGSGNAKQTIQAAWNFIRDYTDGPPAIQMAAGTYPPQGELDGDTTTSGMRLIPIIGDETLFSPPVILCAGLDAGLVFRDAAWSTVAGITFASAGSFSLGVNLQQKALADLNNCLWGDMPSGVHVSIDDGADCNITGPQFINGSAGVHWSVGNNAKLLVGTVPITGSGARNFSVAFLENVNARVELQGPTFSGTSGFTGSKYLLAQHAVVSSGGTTLPGNAAGTADATSNYF